MKKKCVYVWSVVVALVMTACSSDQNEAIDASAKTGTFEISIAFDASNQGETRASTAIPTTGWTNIKQLQFFLYNPTTGSVAWSDIVYPNTTAGTTSKTYAYTTIPAGNYTLVAVANAQSATDDVATYVGGAVQPWSVGNVYLKDVSTMLIKHKGMTGWPATINPVSSSLTSLVPHTQPSEVFMGSAAVSISSATPGSASISLKREVSMMRVRVDKSNPIASDVDFTVASAAVMLYNLPDQMGISATTGGITSASTPANVLYAGGAFSTATTGYLDDGGNYSCWKETIVFPNNGGRANNANTTANAVTANKYFVVLCGVAQAGHVFANSAVATGGELVFWYGQINEVFTPNIIREVNLVLLTGGLPTPPPGVVEYGGLTIEVNEPLPWGSIVVSTVEV